MTIPEFMHRLKAIPGPWVVVNTAIRRNSDAEGSRYVCPICAVAANPRFLVAWWQVYGRLRLTYADALQIARAADGEDDSGYDPALRQQLLKATVNR